MANAIAFAALLSSITGLAYIIGRKVPQLLSIPQENEESLVATLKNGVEDSTVFKWFSSPEIFLQTLLSKIRIFALKIEGKADEMLMGMRKRSQEESKKFTQGYWKEVGKK